ncbi:LamG domain-containing protein [Paenibacillus agilis]|uniref:LamG domain-containing protein n=1 Tax=Paenibacillus agilis TaxID=3020863 RepID=A0A559IEK7_9BACL|nr:LamG domain-containing protein [Paenibacillus agilis]TVX86091.1 LamG domain-containing protein [Paenibacillus agilis]
MALQNIGALKFDGVNDYAMMSGLKGFPTGDSPRTIEMWIKPEDTGVNEVYFFSYGDIHKARSSFEIALNTRSDPSFRGCISIWAVDSQMRTKNPAIVDWNKWYHVAVSYVGGGLSAGLKIYIDGIRQEIVPINGVDSTTPLDTTLPVGYIGCRHNGHYFKGVVDEVRLWNTERVDYQIKDAMKKVLTGSETGLVSYWRTEETSGGTKVLDYTVSANHLDLYQGATIVQGEIDLQSGQKTEEIGLPVNLSTGTFDRMEYVDGKLQLKKLYEIRANGGSASFGDGSLERPYLIKDAQDFYSMRDKASSHYKMIQDIDFGVEPFLDGTYYGFDFYGTLDGNGHKIKNFKQIFRSQFCTGIFRRMLGNSAIKNLYIEDAYIELKGSSQYQGIICGLMLENSSLTNVHVSGSIKSRGGTDVYIGTIGSIGNKASITNMNLNVKIDIDEPILRRYVGLLAGYSNSDNKFNNVLIEGDIVGLNHDANYIGLIVGLNYTHNLDTVFINMDKVTSTFRHVNNQGYIGSTNNSFSNARKKEFELKDASLYSNWDKSVWSISMHNVPKMKIFNKSIFALAGSGEWESEALDMKDRYTLLNKLINVQNINEGSKIEIYTQTSEDGSNWSQYVPLRSDGSVMSPKARYAKVKVRMSAGRRRQESEVEGFNGEIDYDKSEFLVMNEQQINIKMNMERDFVKEETYTGGGHLYKAKLFANGIKRLNGLGVRKR